MKPTREEILSASYFIQGTITDIERFALAMYRKGQEDMRERAALEVQQWFDPCEPWITPKTIRALPIGDRND